MPATTTPPTPTDVIESREGYDVLRNGLFRYHVPSITIADQQIDVSGTGGIALWVRTSAYKWTVFKPTIADGPSPQSIVYRDLFRCFANQVNVDVPTFVSQARAGDWVVNALFPDNIADTKTKYPPIAPIPVTIDFKQPFVIAAGAPSLIEGLDTFSGTYDYYVLTVADDFRELLAVSAAGQLVWCSQSGFDYSKASIGPAILGERVGEILSIVGSLGVVADDAYRQLFMPMVTYGAPSYRVPPDLPVPNPFESTVMDKHDYVEWSWQPPVFNSKLFDEIDLQPTT